MALAALDVLSSGMRMCPSFPYCPNSQHWSSADGVCSVEHGAVKVVAVNDPFIEPHYAVCFAFPQICRFATRARQLTPLPGVHAEI